MSRPIISYDDITLPYDAPVNAVLLPTTSNNSNSAGHPPPSKKRKKNHNNQKGKQRNNNNNNWSNSGRDKEGSISNSKNHHQHQQPVHGKADDGEYGGEGQWGEEEEESRELTHEEIWDDSALVDAWDAAMEEYEEYHGTDKDWKQEPAKKSALWYNVPMDPSKLSSNGGGPFLAATASTDDAAPEESEEDSKPLDFNTFVPTHDPTLDPSPPADYPPLPLPLPPPANYTGVPAPAGDTTTDYTAPGPGHIVSQDEAFQRALSAMYWGGYWTAMYHAQRHISQSNPTNFSTTSPAPATAPLVQQVSAAASVHVHADNIEEEYIPEEGEDSKIEIDPAEEDDDEEGEYDDLVSTQR